MMNLPDETPPQGAPASDARVPGLWRQVGIGVASIAVIVGGGIGIYRLERPADVTAALAEPPRPELTPIALDSAVPADDASASPSASAAPEASASNAAAVAADATPRPEPSPVVDDTIGRMEQRLADDPENAQGWRMLGWAYFQNERYKDAARALRKASLLEPDHAETFSFLGEALVLSNQRAGRMPRAARIAFDRALALDPRNARARYFKALALDLSGQHRRALRAWFAQLSETPPDAPYASDIRAVIRSVGKRHHIEVEKRLAIADAEARLPKPDKPKADKAAKKGGVLPGPAHAELKTASGPQQRGVASGGKEAMSRGMVDSLEARLARNPRNVDGWILLVSSRVRQNQPDAAARALRNGVAGLSGDPASVRKLREAAARLGVS